MTSSFCNSSMIQYFSLVNFILVVASSLFILLVLIILSTVSYHVHCVHQLTYHYNDMRLFLLLFIFVIIGVGCPFSC